MSTNTPPHRKGKGLPEGGQFAPKPVASQPAFQEGDVSVPGIVSYDSYMNNLSPDTTLESFKEFALAHCAQATGEKSIANTPFAERLMAKPAT